VVDFGAPRPFPAYFREHSPDYGSYHGRVRDHVDLASVPGFVPAGTHLAKPVESKAQDEMNFTTESAHSEADTSPNLEAGRPRASCQLVFNASSFESGRVRGLREGLRDRGTDQGASDLRRSRVDSEIPHRLLVTTAMRLGIAA
jgi:hypothetical protein